jgi:hypothetical protein
MQKKMPLFILLFEILAIFILHAVKINSSDHAAKQPGFSVSGFSHTSQNKAGSTGHHPFTQLYHFIK